MGKFYTINRSKEWKLEHNGVEVLCQYVPYYEFIENLNQNGIKPTELPVMPVNYIVMSYDLDSITKYAVVGKARDQVFLTTKVPEDGWDSLIKDCNNQASGGKPSKMRSRFSIALEKAEERAYSWVEEKVPNAKPNVWTMDISGYSKEAQDKFINKVHFSMEGEYGYNKDYIEQIQLTPREKEIINKILNYEYYWEQR
ncbi:hypothetical protein ACR75P_08165 [Faecalicoccus pleomorphus]|uniref:hypothetical protein n=1 Tax=Faecalicoccus pleomorphus TaxID=1323 RepID=UPI003DA364BA